MVNKKLADIGHILIWIALVTGIWVLGVYPNPTIEILKTTITTMGWLISIGGLLLLVSQHESKPKTKVYVLGTSKETD